MDQLSGFYLIPESDIFINLREQFFPLRRSSGRPLDVGPSGWVLRLRQATLCHCVEVPLEPPEGSIFVLLRDEVKRSPGRPEELHLQSPTDPYVSLATHTARASPCHTAFSRHDDAESERFLPVPWLTNLSLSWLLPFAPLALQEVPHYYGRIRPLPLPRYFPLSWTPLIGFSLRITGRVPTFCLRAQPTLVRPVRRVSPRQ